MSKLLRHMTYRARALRRGATPAEQRLWQVLRNHRLDNAKFRRQHALGRYVVDFYCESARLIIELDGASHFPTPRRDVQRDAFLRACGMTVLRFENCEILERLEDVLRAIRSHLFTPSPFGRGAG